MCPRCGGAVALHEGRPFVNAAGSVELWHRDCFEDRDALIMRSDPLDFLPARPKSAASPEPSPAGQSSGTASANPATAADPAPAASPAPVESVPTERPAATAGTETSTSTLSPARRFLSLGET